MIPDFGEIFLEKLKKGVDMTELNGIITYVVANAEGYRSGHNGAVLKTVWVQAPVGSNPTPSARDLGL